MKKLLALSALFLAALPAFGARLVVTVKNDSGLARPSETITVPYMQIVQLLDPAHANPQYWVSRTPPPKVRFDNLLVKDAAGKEIPSQVVNLDTKGGRNWLYNDLIFQHDFAAGEKSATFTIDAIDGTVPPYPAKVFARFAPDRLDDFAWENDLIAHRIYGPTLELPIAGPDLMPVGGSGVDVWSKRFPYFIIDRWYAKGHNPLHTDTGEGLDMYETGQARGDGGTGVWDGSVLHVSRNFRTQKLLANGPIRVVFEVGYQPWDAGNGAQIAETKRYTMDAGHYLDLVECSYGLSGADEVTVGVGITRHTTRNETSKIDGANDEKTRWEGIWETYPGNGGQLGTGVVMTPDARFTGFAKSQTNSPDATSKPLRPDDLILAKIKNGETLRFYAGAAWDQLGPVKSAEQWDAYLAAWAARLAAPVTVSVALDTAK